MRETLDFNEFSLLRSLRLMIMLLMRETLDFNEFSPNVFSKQRIIGSPPGVRQKHTIPDVWWKEKKVTKGHPHQQSIELQVELIEAVSNEGDYVIDPAAGSFSVMESAHLHNRNFIGCDLEGYI